MLARIHIPLLLTAGGTCASKFDQTSYWIVSWNLCILFPVFGYNRSQIFTVGLHHVCQHGNIIVTLWCSPLTADSGSDVGIARSGLVCPLVHNVRPLIKDLKSIKRYRAIVFGLHLTNSYAVEKRSSSPWSHVWCQARVPIADVPAERGQRNKRRKSGGGCGMQRISTQMTQNQYQSKH